MGLRPTHSYGNITAKFLHPGKRLPCVPLRHPKTDGRKVNLTPSTYFSRHVATVKKNKVNQLDCPSLDEIKAPNAGVREDLNNGG